MRRIPGWCSDEPMDYIVFGQTGGHRQDDGSYDGKHGQSHDCSWGRQFPEQVLPEEREERVLDRQKAILPITLALEERAESIINQNVSRSVLAHPFSLTHSETEAQKHYVTSSCSHNEFLRHPSPESESPVLPHAAGGGDRGYSDPPSHLLPHSRSLRACWEKPGGQQLQWQDSMVRKTYRSP